MSYFHFRHEAEPGRYHLSGIGLLGEARLDHLTGHSTVIFERAQNTHIILKDTFAFLEKEAQAWGTQYPLQIEITGSRAFVVKALEKAKKQFDLRQEDDTPWVFRKTIDRKLEEMV